ncbi:hypothetical protein AUK10_02935 [Candidatus Gracilibacteria bacterium CG2_30_37_12]|nr:MAG: hypothetical protein AUK10_02935 [Candidatus Gracilibacteria bacterium CG2_30_37_12]
MAQILDKTRSVVLVKFSTSEFKRLHSFIDDDKKEQLLRLTEDTEVNGVEFKSSKEMFKYLNK